MALRTRYGGSQTPDYWLKLAQNTHTEREKARADALEEKVQELETIIKKMNLKTCQ